MCTYLRGTRCSAPPYAQFIKPMGVVYGGWDSNHPSSGYRDINQLLASDKIGCSGSECFSNPDEVPRIFSLSAEIFLQINHIHTNMIIHYINYIMLYEKTSIFFKVINDKSKNIPTKYDAKTAFIIKIYIFFIIKRCRYIFTLLLIIYCFINILLYTI